MREIAIINNHETDFSQDIIKFIKNDTKVTVFRTFEYSYEHGDNVDEVEIPKEINTESKIKNFVSKYYFDKGYNGFLHVIEDCVQIYNDPTVFMDEIEIMMDKLNQKSWFNTVTDPCNYTFKKYNPRASVSIDEEKAKEVYDKTIFWTSHANTSWICYDYNKVQFDDIKFNEDFSVAMFYIIEFLAQRRNLKKEGDLYYMNYYPTVKEELNVFKLKQVKENKKDEKEIQETMKNENEIFTKLNINHDADGAIEPIIEGMFNILTKEK